jgi:signal transduction histidine kinase
MPPLAYIAATASFALVLATLAAIARGRRTPAHFAFAMGMAIFAVESLVIGQLNATWTEPEYIRLIGWRHALLALIPAPWLWFSIAYSRGNAREYLQRWRWLLLGMFVVPIILVVIGRDQLVGLAPVPNTGGLTVPVLGLTGFGLHLVALITSVLILSNLERTFRSAIGTLRWRIKLTMIGLVVLFGCRIYTGSQALLYRSINPPLELLNCAALILACGLVAASVVRTKVFAIELYPSPAVLRHSLTLVLAGAYLLIVGVLARIVTALGETTGFPAQAFLVLVALVGLTLALMSDRVRQHLQRFVSRHLRRPSYDYRQTWLTFSQQLSPQVTVPGLCDVVVRWTSDTLHTLSVTLWVVDDAQSRLGFGGSTALAEELRPGPLLTESDLAELSKVVRSPSLPINLERAPEPWAEALRRRCPSQFPDRGGDRWLVPLVSNAGANTIPASPMATPDDSARKVELLGVMVIGDRVNGLPLSIEDLDLLKCVGDQVAANLLTLRLSQQLLRARELEAFQTMSAFFVHDLKNTASTLSLMLQNLPRHFDNPAFRDDALRALRHCVDRIDNQVAQLSLLRKGLDLNPQPADLNALVNRALEPLEQVAGARITRTLQPVSELSLDAAQTVSVITNLVLNALEAMDERGQVRIATNSDNGTVELSVSDTGCGMSPEFIRDSLFRPFRTTKKKGTGLGLYQSKQIVEAHGGRIQVQSEPGKGTVVKIQFGR